MPARDATGPLGQGPMTGRGLGQCVSGGTAQAAPVNQPVGVNATAANSNVQPAPNRPGMASFARPRGFFRACGRGFRGAGGRGRGRR